MPHFLGKSENVPYEKSIGMLGMRLHIRSVDQLHGEVLLASLWPMPHIALVCFVFYGSSLMRPQHDMCRSLQFGQP